MRHPAGVRYRVEVADLHAHLFRVQLRISRPAPQQRLSLPVWIPGSYLVREFARNLQRLRATQGGRVLSVLQLDKHSWELQCPGSEPVLVEYEVLAYDNSVRAAWLDAQRGFFNGTSMFLRVHGRESAPHALNLPSTGLPRSWQIATALPKVKTSLRGAGSYLARDYDTLVDCPVEMGPLWSGAFTAMGVRHRFVVQGAAPSMDGERLLADTRRICEAAIRFWHAGAGAVGAPRRPPHRDYLFMLNVQDEGYGGLEHRNSTALVAARRDLPRLAQPTSAVTPARPGEGYATLLGLISHEYFHTWNVKRLRPAEFSRYDYDRENYTSLLWFFEGFTSYYDDLLLRRCGLIDDAHYLRSLTKTLNQVQQTPGRLVQTVAQASFDAWVKYYRQDENTPNATVSYYTKGAAVALCLDLSLRSHGTTTLDAVMRGLWQRCKAGPMDEADLHQVLLDLSGRSWTRELAQWVHSTEELPLKTLLEQHGVAVLEEPAQLAQALGLRVTESNGGIQIKTVLRGGPAEVAGLAAGDEWLAVEVAMTAATSGWRLQRLDDLVLYTRPAEQVTAIVARDKRLLRLPLRMPQAITTWRLTVRDASLVTRWLAA